MANKNLQRWHTHSYAGTFHFQPVFHVWALTYTTKYVWPVELSVWFYKAFKSLQQFHVKLELESNPNSVIKIYFWKFKFFLIYIHSKYILKHFKFKRQYVCLVTIFSYRFHNLLRSKNWIKIKSPALSISAFISVYVILEIDGIQSSKMRSFFHSTILTFVYFYDFFWGGGV